jgi:poly(3-hydroxyalkanoate) synthetase
MLRGAANFLHNPSELPSLTPEDTTAFLHGVQRYRTSTWQRPQETYKTLLTHGRTKLYDTGGEGECVLMVPSMINRGYILDLMPGMSLAHHLRQSGFRVLLVDWGNPETDLGDPLSLDTAITERLIPYITHIHQQTGKPLHLFGYCMGGVMAMGAASVLSQTGMLKSLSMVAVPWDFSHTTAHGIIKNLAPLYGLILNAIDYIHADIIQSQFVMLEPLGAIKRMQAYASEQDATHLNRLTALEDWLADGIALESGVAKSIVFDWHLHNKPHKGEWLLNAHAVEPRRIDVPWFVGITQKDVIVPSASAMALVEQAQQQGKTPHVVNIPAGHVGVVAGRKATDTFFTPLAQWLKTEA